MNDFVNWMQYWSLVFVKLLFSSLIAYIIGFKMLFLALGWAMLFDLITGIFAFTKREQLRFSIKRKEYIIRSYMLRSAFNKMGSYLLIILLMAIFETHIFKIQFQSINSIVGQTFYGTAIVTTVCIIIEYWSVLENLKILGFDLVGQFSSILIKLINTKKDILK